MNINIKTISIAVITFALTAFSAGDAFADYYKDGMRNYIRKNYDKAREQLLKAVEQGDRGNAYYFLGEIERTRSNFADAEKYYELAVNSKSINKGYLKNAYWNLLALAERMQDYRKVVKISKGMWFKLRDGGARQKIDSIINKFLWTDNEEAVEKYRRGMSLKVSGNTEGALKAFSEASDIDHQFLAPRFEMGMISYKEGKNDKALYHLGAVADKIEFYAEVQLILGEVQYARNNYSVAIAHFNNAHEFGMFDAETEYLIKTKRGTCLFQTGEYAQSMADFTGAMKINKSAIQPYIMIAAIHTKENEYAKAMNVLEKANKMQPNNPVILFQMGSIFYKQDDERYMECFDKTFDLIRDHENYSEKYNKMVTLLIAEHYKKQDLARVTEIISFVPEDRQSGDIIRIGALTYFTLKNYEKAIGLFQKVSLGSEDKFTLSIAYARSGRTAKAKEILSPLIGDDRYLQKARKDKTLAPIVREIEASLKEKSGVVK